MKTLLTLLLAALLCGSALAESRVWTSTNGKTVEAELVSATATHVRLKRHLDDVLLTVPIASLSEADQAFISAHGAKDAPAAVDLTAVRRKFTTQLEKKKGVVRDDLRDIPPAQYPSGLEYLRLLGEKDKNAWRGLGSSRSVIRILTAMRAEVAALPDTPETKSFLAHTLDPVLAAIAAHQANPSTMPPADVFTKLHATLSDD